MPGRILVTGATGQLGAYLVRELAGQGTPVVAWGHAQGGAMFGVPFRPVELADPDEVAAAFAVAQPATVIHAGAMAAVGDCARDPDRAAAVNVGGTHVLAELCAAAGARLVLVSTDLVFDGERPPYTEADPPGPLSVYGRTKVEAERAVLVHPGHAVVRVSLLFGPSLNGRGSFFSGLVEALRAGRAVRPFEDEWRTPLGLAAAARALIGIASSGVAGLWHVGGPERMSRLEMGRRLAAYLGVDPGLIEAVSRATAPGEPRPRDTSLDSVKWRTHFADRPWPGFEPALAEMGV